MNTPVKIPRYPDMPPTPAQRHRWRHVSLRGGGYNVCERCGLLVTNFRNRETNHFELRYHQREGLTTKAGKCGNPGN